MNKRILLGIACWIPLTVLAEANLPTESASKTFLLTAPGTLTGKVPGENPDGQEVTVTRSAEIEQQPLRYKPQRYKQGGESYKFPQYGQVYGRYNPWSEQGANRRLPPPLPPASPYYSNPWDLGGTLPAQTPQYSPGPYGYYQPHQRNYEYYGYPQNMNSGFPGSIYGDTNPASSMPFFNNMMPGLGGGNNGTPFSPFGMF